MHFLLGLVFLIVFAAILSATGQDRVNPLSKNALRRMRSGNARRKRNRTFS
jgi:hypothetical protein